MGKRNIGDSAATIGARINRAAAKRRKTNAHKREEQLSPKEEMFCLAFAGGATGADAARRAGYAEGPAGSPQLSIQANRLLKRAKVKARVDALLAEEARTAIKSRDEVLRTLQTYAEEARQARQYAAAIKAIELVGKAVGTWLEEDATAGSGRDLAKMSADEMAELARQAALRLAAMLGSDTPPEIARIGLPSPDSVARLSPDATDDDAKVSKINRLAD